MLTVDTTLLALDQPVELWVIELDHEYGHVQVLGRSTVTRHRHGLSSHVTGGDYAEPYGDEQVQTWTAEEHTLNVFASEQAMRDGARHIAAARGDMLPVGIHRVLTA